MNERERMEKTVRVLNAITTFNLDSFDDRLRLQKIVYIGQELGLNLGYSFDWYLRGPYSPSLTHMLFTARENAELIIPQENLSLSNPEKENVERVQKFINNDIANPRTLELIASVWYFLPNRILSTEEKQSLIEKIHEKKPRYTINEVENAIDKIIDYRSS